MASSSAARAAHHRRTLQWGYRWALWAAVLWGAWYVPGTAVWHESPFAGMDLSDPRVFLVCAAVITAFHSVMVMIFQWVWLGSLGKLSDYFRTLGQFRKISRWYFIAAVVGGLMANFGTMTKPYHAGRAAHAGNNPGAGVNAVVEMASLVRRVTEAASQAPGARLQWRIASGGMIGSGRVNSGSSSRQKSLLNFCAM